MLLVKNKPSLQQIDNQPHKQSSPDIRNDNSNKNGASTNFMDDFGMLSNLSRQSHQTNGNEMDLDDIDDLDYLDDLDDLDDEDLDDCLNSDDISDDSDDGCSSTSCSSLNNSTTVSPSSLTTTNTNGSTCSTPTKTKLKGHKSAASTTLASSIAQTIAQISGRNMSMSGTKTSGKKSKKMIQNSNGGLSLAKQQRNNRFNSMGYSSDNPAEKRAFHILSERQRRNDLKKLFETLRMNIPTLGDKQKASKLTILKAAVDHLVEVGNRRERLQSHFEKEKTRNAQLLQHLKGLQVAVLPNSSPASNGFSSCNTFNLKSQSMAVH